MTNTPRPILRRAGFTLTEVLIAMGILALGIVAVASLFPTAALLQKEAVNETLRQNHIRSGDAILEGVGINNITLLEFMEWVESEPSGEAFYNARNYMDDPSYDVFALAEVDLTVDSSYDGAATTQSVTIPGNADDFIGSGVASGVPDMRLGSTSYPSSYVYDIEKYPTGNFSVAMRSLPSITPAIDDGTALPNYRDREVFFVPLIRQGIEASEIFPDWNVYLFVLQPPSQLRTNGAYANANYAAGDFNGLICANPGDGNYVPKVFRVRVNWDATDPNVIDPPFDLDGYLKAGELVLGDNGKMYRVSKFDPDPSSDKILLDPQTLYEPINDRDLTAIWCAPAPGGINQDSPLGDLRLLSNSVVRAPIQ